MARLPRLMHIGVNVTEIETYCRPVKSQSMLLKSRYNVGPLTSGQMTSVQKKDQLFFRFFGTNEHPIAGVKLSLGDAATHFRSAIDLWRSLGRFIGLNEENANFQKIQFFNKKNILKIDPGDYAVTWGPSGGL